MRHGRRWIAAACALALSLVPAAAAQARLGDLDPGFGAGGIATPNVGGVAGARFEAVATRADGRPVAAGTDAAGAFVAQLTNAGAPDTFGTSGVARIPNGGFVYRLHGVTVDGQDRVLAAGDRRASTEPSPPAPGTPLVVRLTPGGALDGEFPIAGGFGEARAIVPLPGGAMLVAGWFGTNPGVFFVAKLDATGQLAPSNTTPGGFGTRGIATANFGPNAHAEAIAVAPDGRIVLAGWVDRPAAGPPPQQPALARFNSDGTPDNSFDGDGRLTLEVADLDAELHAVQVDGAGRITAAGISGNRALVVRRQPDDGAPDNGFGAGGATYGPSPSRLNGIALDGARALVAGADGTSLLLGSLDGAGFPEPALGGAPPGWRGFPGAPEAFGAALGPGGTVYTAGGPAPFVSRHLPNAAPAAALSGPAQVVAGAPAVFDASGSSDPEGEQLRYAFDLDGNGDFEFDGGTNPLALRSFAAPGGYSVRVRVTDPRGASATAARAITVVAAPGPPPPQPILGKQGVAKPLRGVVRFRLPGTKKFLPLLDLTAIPNGTEIDARKGRLLLTVLHDASGQLDGARFYAGRFIFRQGKGEEPITRLKLSGGSFDSCTIQPQGASVATTASVKGGTGTGTRRTRRRVRRLWGDGRGRFRTRGRYGAATVRGTKWLTLDRCDGTKIRVVRGKVGVRGFARPRRGEQLLTAGESTFLPAVQRGG